MTDESRDVLLVSNFTGHDYSKFRDAFQKALRLQAPQVNYQEVVSVAELPTWFARHASPHVLIVDWTQAARAKVDARQIEQALRGVRELERNACVLMLTDQMPTGGDTMNWLDRGATALLHREFKADHLNDALGEILARRLNTQIQRSPRVEAKHEVRLRLASLEQGVVAESINVGLGGLFVRCVPQGAKTGDRVDFRLVLSKDLSAKGWSDDENLGEIRGEGIIAWVRPLANAEGPEGVGIQFTELEAASKQLLENFVSARRVQAFIPKA